MMKFMDKKQIIMLKEQGLSNREVARQTGADRKTVSKYWNEYRQRLQQLDGPGADVKAIQESLQYTSQAGVRRAYGEFPHILAKLQE